MPSTYAHLVFGRSLLASWPKKLRRAAGANIELFLIGLHGPDILFYYRPLKPNPVSAVGFGQHEKPAAAFFGPAAELVHRSDESIRADQRAYLLGFICHFALDLACHGYVERKIREGVSHSEIEVEFDRSLMVDDGLDPLRHVLTGHIHPGKENAALIAPFFPGVTAGETDKALRGMIFYNRLLLAPHRWQRDFVTGLLKLTGNDIEMRGLMVKLEPDPRCADSCLRLKKLMAKAEKQCTELAAEYMRCLEDETLPLPEAMKFTFGPAPGWEKLPVLKYEEELAYEV